jgi:hypothetical protein
VKAGVAGVTGVTAWERCGTRSSVRWMAQQTGSSFAEPHLCPPVEERHAAAHAERDLRNLMQGHDAGTSRAVMVEAMPG